MQQAKPTHVVSMIAWVVAWSCASPAPAPSPRAALAPAAEPTLPPATRKENSTDPHVESSEQGGARKGGDPAAETSDPSFHTDFAAADPGYPWNVFGAKVGVRRVFGGPDGLWLKIVSGEKSWDAVGLRTARIEIDGDFDLRAGYRDFVPSGNGSAKLLVVDAKGSRGEAAYVERIRIDGKSLLKFGGEVDGSLENWGFVANESTHGELRLVRRDGRLNGFARPNENEPWSEIAPAQSVPRSMPRLVKFGVKLSSEAQKSAQVRWPWLTMRGAVVRAD